MLLHSKKMLIIINIVCLYCFSEPSYVTIEKVYQTLKKDFKDYILYYENYLNERMRKHEETI